MNRINSLSDLLMEELVDLINAENQLIEALPKMSEISQAPSLKTVLEDHLEMTKKHAGRLQDIFNKIGQQPQVRICEAIKELVVESQDIANRSEKGSARDADIINVAQRVAQYEIFSYQTAREHAADLGHTRMVELLTDTLNEERAMNLHLNELAQNRINVQATSPLHSSQEAGQQKDISSPKEGGFYMPKGKFGRKGIKKKYKSKDISRFIDEGNPNIQESQEKGKEDL